MLLPQTSPTGCYALILFLPSDAYFSSPFSLREREVFEVIPPEATLFRSRRGKISENRYLAANAPNMQYRTVPTHSSLVLSNAFSFVDVKQLSMLTHPAFLSASLSLSRKPSPLLLLMFLRGKCNRFRSVVYPSYVSCNKR